MTDEPEVLQLPERTPLDAESAAAMAVMEELDKQLLKFPDATVAFDPRPIARAVLDAVDGKYPRIPEWTGDERELGGGRRPGQLDPDPLIRITSPMSDGRVRIEIERDGEPSPDIIVPAGDAEQWLLAGLAAVRAAREIESS